MLTLWAMCNRNLDINDVLEFNFDQLVQLLDYAVNTSNPVICVFRFVCFINVDALHTKQLV